MSYFLELESRVSNVSATHNQLAINMLFGLIALALAPAISVADVVKGTLHCQGYSHEGAQFNVLAGSLEFGEITKQQHTYTFPEETRGEYKRWRLDKYGKLTDSNEFNIKDLYYETDLNFRNDNPQTVCIFLFLYDKDGERVPNKSTKFRELQYVQWAFIIKKEHHDREEPINLLVVFDRTVPPLSEKATLFYIKAFVPTEGGDRLLDVLEPVIALELGE